MKLSEVSKTAIATIRCHVIESQKKNPILNDPMAAYCLERLMSMATEKEKALLFNRKLSFSLTNHIALRARKYDRIVNDFISNHPSCTLINLGCGFDTRFWRINNKECTYIELDLPESVAMKKEIFKDKLSFELIGCSVLDPSWIEKVTAKGSRNFLLVAEGLFMYLPKEEVIPIFKKISTSFNDSQFVLEVVTEKYTRGIWKKMVEMKIKQSLGLDAGSYYNFGIGKAEEIESYGEGIKIINEWSYMEDPDIRPKAFKYFSHIKSFTRTQWTVTASINRDPI
jgi:methyltransferase (TIGR00027 family)